MTIRAGGIIFPSDGPVSGVYSFVELAIIGNIIVFYEDRNPYNEVLDELYNVMDVLHIERVDRPVQSAFLNVREILDYISEIHQKLDDINEIKEELKK